MPVAVGALWALSQAILLVPGWAVPMPVVIVALPIWYFLEETTHIANRSLLEKIFTSESKLRNFLWQGRILSVKNAIISFFWAIAFLSVAALMEQVHWYLLGLDAVILALVAPLISAQVGRETS